MTVHRTTRRVEIYDTDASGLIFYGAPTRWFADAEQGLYDLIGMRWPMMDSAAAVTGLSAPTRSYEVHLDGPLHFHDDFEMETWISAVGRSSFAMSHRVSVDGEIRVRGTIRRVAVRIGDRGTMTPVEVPEPIRSALVDRDG